METSVDFLPRRLESIAVSPVRKKKFINKTTLAPPPPPYVSVTNLQDLPDELMSEVLAFLTPNADHPMLTKCGIVVVSRASKAFRTMALSDQMEAHLRRTMEDQGRLCCSSGQCRR